MVGIRQIGINQTGTKLKRQQNGPINKRPVPGFITRRNGENVRYLDSKKNKNPKSGN